MNYTNLIRRPFEIVARRPYLWLLGFLAGGATGFNFGGSGTRYSQPGTYSGPTWASIQHTVEANWGWISAVILVAAVICLILFIVGCVATGGIVHAAIEHDAGRPYDLRQAWHSGYSTAWRIAGLRILTFLLAVVPAALVAVLVLAAVAAGPADAGAAAGLGILAGAVLLAAIGFWIILVPATELAQRFIVLEGEHAASALTNGFRTIRVHFKEVALGWLILAGLSIGAGIAVAIVAVIVAVVALAVGFAGWALASTIGAVIAGTFAAVFFLGIIAAVAGALSAYASVYWTLLYRDIRALPARPARTALVPAHT